MSVDFRPVGPVHAALLAGMHRVCFAEPWDERAMAELLAMPGVFGLLDAPVVGDADDDCPHGFILCRLAADEAELLTLLVLPPYRRGGLARRLLRHAMAAARHGGATVLFLEVAADNGSARALYSAEGFEQVGCRPRYYRNCIDALVMKRRL
jgi:ribosomal-protein-alanine N-acetyltransferase